MKIYTRTGDRGETGLFGGGRVPKSDPRVEAYGTVDEANAALGVARSSLASGTGDAELDALLARLQGDLFDLGADLATPLDAAARRHVRAITEEDVTRLEGWIDRLDGELPPLTTFVLPSGTAAAASLHVARGIVRRAERRVVVLAAVADLNGSVLRFLNRLSDLLFTLARVANARAGREEEAWRPASSGG